MQRNTYSERSEDKKNRGPKQGKFSPKFPKKYRGDVTKIIYRSSWEKKTMQYLDSNPNVLQWSSEEIIIPYISPLDNRRHRYFPDFWVRMKEPSGKIKEAILEVKPRAQTQVPVKKKRITKRLIHEVTTYAVNEAKWRSAQAFCAKYGLEFMIITEQDIFGK